MFPGYPTTYADGSTLADWKVLPSGPHPIGWCACGMPVYCGDTLAARLSHVEVCPANRPRESIQAAERRTAAEVRQIQRQRSADLDRLLREKKNT